MAPREAPATFPPALAAEFNVPPAAPPTLAAVFVTVPAAPPAAEVTPPNAPRPPAIPGPAAEPLRPPIVSISEPAAERYSAPEQRPESPRLGELPRHASGPPCQTQRPAQ